MTTVLASQKAYFERLDPNRYRADTPCDTGITWIMLDNLAHCVDSSHGYRVNYVDHVGIGANVTGKSTVFSGLFPVTIARDGRWPNFHCRVAVARGSSSGTMNVHFGLSTALGPFPVHGPGSGVLGYLGASNIPISNPTWVIDGFIQDIDPGNAQLTKVTIPSSSGEGGTQPTGQHVMARWSVQLELVAMTGIGAALMNGLQIREYPSS
jgi:hypothetical protein